MQTHVKGASLDTQNCIGQRNVITRSNNRPAIALPDEPRGEKYWIGRETKVRHPQRRVTRFWGVEQRIFLLAIDNKSAVMSKPRPACHAEKGRCHDPSSDLGWLAYPYRIPLRIRCSKFSQLAVRR